MATSYGQQIRDLRTIAQVPQMELAARLGIDKPKWCERETGARDMTEAEFLRAQAALIEIVEERAAAFDKARKGKGSEAA